ncbi:MAG: hypothetical protein HQK51_01950 [Oligoflexia bacterium]|nr:hypothetical protein [Oligoflexia bacterium]
MNSNGINGIKSFILIILTAISVLFIFIGSFATLSFSARGECSKHVWNRLKW